MKSFSLRLLLLLAVTFCINESLSSKYAARTPEGEDSKLDAAEKMKKWREQRIKDRAERPKPQRPQPKDFSSPRIQNIWETAQKKFSKENEKDTLAEIKKDLTRISTMEVELRKKGNEVNENSEEVKKLREELKSFFEKHEKLNPRPNKLTLHNDSVLLDPHLKELWARVKYMNFLQDKDIQELTGEFLYCQDQINANNYFLNEDKIYSDLNELGIETISGVLKQGNDSVNELLQQFYSDHDKEQVRRAFDMFKSVAKEVSLCYEQLDHYTNDSLRKEGFKEPLVSKLWREAEKSNMTKLELQAFRAELEAFQHRLGKQKRMERQSTELERRFVYKVQQDDKLPHPVKMDMAKKVVQMKEESVSRKDEVMKLYKSLTAKLFTVIPKHLPDEL